MLVTMKMQTGVRKLVLHSDKIYLNNRPGLAPTGGWWKEPGEMENNKQAPPGGALQLTQVLGITFFLLFASLPSTPWIRLHVSSGHRERNETLGCVKSWKCARCQSRGNRLLLGLSAFPCCQENLPGNNPSGRFTCPRAKSWRR